MRFKQKTYHSTTGSFAMASSTTSLISFMPDSVTSFSRAGAFSAPGPALKAASLRMLVAGAVHCCPLVRGDATNSGLRHTGGARVVPGITAASLDSFDNNMMANNTINDFISMLINHLQL